MMIFETVANYPDMTSFNWGVDALGTPVYSIEVAFDKTYTSCSNRFKHKHSKLL